MKTGATSKDAAPIIYFTLHVSSIQTASLSSSNILILQSHYQLVIVSQKENPYVFSDKLRICVVNLSRIVLATEQDKASGIDLRARVFTATTWEEIDMLAQNNEYLQETVSGIRQLTEEEKIRQQCEARETNAYWERIREAARKRELAEKDATISEQAARIAELEAKLAASNQ